MPLLSSSRRTLAALAAVLSFGLLAGCAEDAQPAVDTSSSSAADPTPTREALTPSENSSAPYSDEENDSKEADRKSVV